MCGKALDARNSICYQACIIIIMVLCSLHPLWHVFIYISQLNYVAAIGRHVCIKSSPSVSHKV